MSAFDQLKIRYAEQRRVYGLSRNLEMNEDGVITLGAGTVIAHAQRAGDTLRIFAKLAATFGCAVEPASAVKVLGVLEKASELWRQGEKCLAQIHLSHVRLPPLEEREAFALFATDALISSGVSSCALLAGLGVDPAYLGQFEKYNPDQPRVPAGNGRESGRWGSGGGGSAKPIELIGHDAVLSDISAEAAAPTIQVAQEAKCSAFITENCKGGILREFPSEYLDVSVDKVLQDANSGIPAARKAKKLLFDNRFRK